MDRVPGYKWNGNVRWEETGGGVAYAAHIGGFIAGLALIKLFDIGIGKNRVLNS
jgi:membrane associated rhomboid family serine protease